LEEANIIIFGKSSYLMLKESLEFLKFCPLAASRPSP
jgi:hypothetical protein